MSKRLYVGKLPMDARPDDVKSFFEGYGTMTDCRILTGFGFIEFETEKDADEIVRNFNGKSFMGQDIIVEFAKESRPRRNYEDRGPSGGSYRGEGGYRGGGPPGGGRSRGGGVRLVVTGVSRDTSWQDLKDFARQAGNVTFADIDRDAPNQGLIEYPTREEADSAIRELDGKEIRGTAVRVAIDERRSGGGSGGYDRHSGGGGYGRRDRSRSPRRYDDRRSSRYDDDRGGDRRERYDDRDHKRREPREDRGDRGERDDRGERRERY